MNLYRGGKDWSQPCNVIPLERLAQNILSRLVIEPSTIYQAQCWWVLGATLPFPLLMANGDARQTHLAHWPHWLLFQPHASYVTETLTTKSHTVCPNSDGTARPCSGCFLFFTSPGSPFLKWMQSPFNTHLKTVDFQTYSWLSLPGSMNCSLPTTSMWA